MSTHADERAKLIVLGDSESFARALGDESSTLQLYVQKPLAEPKWDSVSSGSEAVKRFNDVHKHVPSHLIMRFFNERIEYAWFGATGVQAELTSTGDLEIVPRRYAEKKPQKNIPHHPNVHVQQLVRNGRVIYEKLARYEPSGADRGGRTMNDQANQNGQEDPCFLWLNALEPSTEEVPLHNQIEATHYWGQLSLKIVGLDPLFIGSGAVDLDDKGMYQCFAHRDGRFIVPASSFKGAWRAIAEVLSPSCLRVIDPRDHDERKVGKVNHKFKECPEVEPDQQSVKLCPACGLFGAPGYRGRLHLSEGWANSGQPEITKIAQRMGPNFCGPDGKADPCASTFKWRKFYRREPVCNEPKSKERLEQLQQGAVFTLSLGFENLRLWELGLLALSLGIAPNHEFNWKLGGGKNRKMGLVQVTWDQEQSSYAQGKDWFWGRSKPLDETLLSQASEAYMKQLNDKVGDLVTKNLNKLKKEYGYGRA